MDAADDSFEYLDCSSSESGSSVDVTSTAIIMVSPPKSCEDDDEGHSKNHRSSQELFQTPPEDSHPPTSKGITPLPEVDRSDDGRHYEDLGDGNGIIVAFDDGTGAVDLGRDTDLGFSEVQASEFRVLRRNLSPEGDVSESPSKKLRVSEEDLGISEHKELVPYNPGCSSGEILEVDCVTEKSDSGGSEFRVMRRDLSPEGGVSESPSKKLRVSEEDLGISEHKELVPYNPGCSSGEILVLDGGNEKSDSGGSEGELDCSDSHSESVVEETASESEEASDVGRQERVEVVMGRIPNVTIRELRRMVSQMQRQDLLPPSMAEPARSSTVDDKKKVQKEFSILDVLKLLKNRHKADGGCVDAVGNGSFLEICRRRGMTFPGHFSDPKVGSGLKK